MDEKDVDGRPFVKERMTIAKTQGKGWQEYRWQNPVTKKVERKVTYVERAGDLVITCGAYKR